MCRKHPISIQEHPEGERQCGGNICAFTYVLFSKSDAGDHFRVNGSDLTITVYRAQLKKQLTQADLVLNELAGANAEQPTCWGTY